MYIGYARNRCISSWSRGWSTSNTCVFKYFFLQFADYLKFSVQKVGQAGSLLSLAKCSIKPYTTKWSLKLTQFDYNIYQQSSYIAVCIYNV